MTITKEEMDALRETYATPPGVLACIDALAETKRALDDLRSAVGERGALLTRAEKAERERDEAMERERRSRSHGGCHEDLLAEVARTAEAITRAEKAERERHQYACDAEHYMSLWNGAEDRAEAAEAGTAVMREALRTLRTDCNRLCDRNLGGTYEDDARKAIREADAALATDAGKALLEEVERLRAKVPALVASYEAKVQDFAAETLARSLERALLATLCEKVEADGRHTATGFHAHKDRCSFCATLALARAALATDAGKALLEEVAALRERNENQAKRIAFMREALEALLDEQNGPPLARREEAWRAAMRLAHAALGRPAP